LEMCLGQVRNRPTGYVIYGETKKEPELRIPEDYAFTAKVASDYFSTMPGKSCSMNEIWDHVGDCARVVEEEVDENGRPVYTRPPLIQPFDKDAAQSTIVTFLSTPIVAPPVERRRIRRFPRWGRSDGDTSECGGTTWKKAQISTIWPRYADII